MSFQVGPFQTAFQQSGVIPTPPPASTGGGASGRSYNTDSLDLSKWAKRKKQIERKIVLLQVEIQEKRNTVNPERVEKLGLQIQSLQVKLLGLLDELDKLRKLQEEDEMEEVMLAYLAYRKLH